MLSIAMTLRKSCSSITEVEHNMQFFSKHHLDLRSFIPRPSKTSSLSKEPNDFPEHIKRTGGNKVNSYQMKEAKSLFVHHFSQMQQLWRV